MAEHKRKLAAIVFTDIVGFTKITADDQTLATSLLDTQRDLLKPIVEEHNGKWLKEMGDGLILIFETVTDAVNGCIKIQEVARDVEHLNLRIGMHEGEILLMENDVIGDDVNIASRIEAFSAPGGIAISNNYWKVSMTELKAHTYMYQKNFGEAILTLSELQSITFHVATL